MNPSFFKHSKLILINILLFVTQYSHSQISNLWVTLRPNVGGISQINDDIIIIINGIVIHDYSSSKITCSQPINTNNLVYSITYFGSMFNKDGHNDQISFNLNIQSYIGATSYYNVEQNTSSVTNYGTPPSLTLINNT